MTPDVKNLEPKAPTPQKSEVDERLDKAIAELIQAGKQKQKRSDNEKKTRFHITTADALKGVLLLVVTAMGLKLFTDQYRLRSQFDDLKRKNVVSVDREIPEELRLSEDEMRASASAFAAKPLVTPVQPLGLPTAKDVGKRPAKTAWSEVVRCSLNARWSDFSSPSFLRLKDDLGLMYANGQVYAMTPTFAGKQRLFTGPFWQKPLAKFFAMIGRDPKAVSPSKVLVFANSTFLDDHPITAYYYAKIYRSGAIERFKPANLEEPMITGKAWVRANDAIVQASGRGGYSVDPRVSALLAKEISSQLQRYSVKKTAPRSFSLVNVGNPYRYDQETHESCLTAADFLNLPRLKLAAKDELQRLQQEGIKRQRQSTILTKLASVSGSFPVATLSAHIQLNSSPLIDCMRRFSTATAPIGFSILRSGVVDPASITVGNSEDRLYKKCITNEIARWQMAGPLNNPIQRFEMQLETLKTAH